jgi:hypothetical protein
MCTTDAENYNILGLDQFSLLPVMPLPSMTTPGTRPHIISSGDGGFVVLQASGDGGIAVFLTASGDPTGILIEMPYFPIDIGKFLSNDVGVLQKNDRTTRSVALDPPYLIALLPNNTIEIHNYTLQPPAIVQIISRPEGFSPHALTKGVSTGYLVPAGERDSKLSITQLPLLIHPPDDPKKDETLPDEYSGSGLTPPPTPAPAVPPKDQTPTTYARARTILVANDAVQSLVPATLLSQAESLLGAGRVKDVVHLLEGVKRKGGDEDQVSRDAFVLAKMMLIIGVVGYASAIHLYPDRLFSASPDPV